MDLGLGQHLEGVADLLVGVALVLGALRSAAFQLLADLIEGGEQHEAVGRRRAVAGRGEIALVHGELGQHQFEHLLLHSRELGPKSAVGLVDVGGRQHQLVALVGEGELAFERRGGAVRIPGHGRRLVAGDDEARDRLVEVEGVGVGVSETRRNSSSWAGCCSAGTMPGALDFLASMHCLGYRGIG